MIYTFQSAGAKVSILVKFGNAFRRKWLIFAAMKQLIHIAGLKELDSAAAEFLEKTAGHSLLAFYGPMGAGKTTFITALCRALGVREDAVSSPTFAIVNEYRGGSGQDIYHFDFYRIQKPEEALDIGLYDYLDSGSLCLMEWPENIEQLLPEESLRIYLKVNPDGSRSLSWED